MKKITFLKTFKKDFKKMVKRGYDPKKFEKVLDMLRSELLIPVKYRDHKLSGNFKGWRDIHIEPDWILIYKITGDEIICADTGTHSDLFK
jgi:mRNA interferase YafQ